MIIPLVRMTSPKSVRFWLIPEWKNKKTMENASRRFAEAIFWFAKGII
jgi:hypothetical protein